MKKILVGVVVLMMLATVVFAGKGGITSANPAGKSDNSIIRLENKDPSDWSIIQDDGIEGVLKYDNNDNSFIAMVNAEGLLPNTEYQLK